MRKVAIVGSRDYPDMNEVRRMVHTLKDCEIVSGGARGVDSVAEDEARKLGIPVTVFPADWERHGKRAGAIRNRQIVDYADQVIAFHDGKSKGTMITVGMAEQAGKLLMLFTPVDRGNITPADVEWARNQLTTPPARG